MSEMIVRLNQDRVKIKGCEYVQDLIRCRDCKYWFNEHQCMKWSVYGTLDVDSNGFCSDGVRKE